MLDAKLGLVRRGVRKLRDQVPAVVTEVSWPSFAAQRVSSWGVLSTKGGFTHVRGDEHPLRKLVCLEIRVKHRKVLDVGQAIEVVGHRIVDDGGIFVRS